ncbi:histidine triad nucleotide-binding protein [Saccharopolyspora sp. NFXS83]|uniref:histidine triad nucleotide-binding protein n=1 Tax=Saccharopolyspora sp. NFXS83 TaxID=2993560 RepID=UPI00224B06DD|nr:histidine triad nucleotide-binding protein [Saccharopolyspora sp. NFXS83]MCX2731602.1 histidine triad nucleotide-binding protein [Saccharopolyspora sp. NFXS83]
MTDSDLDSLFLRIIAGEIPADVVHDGERVLAIRDINPQATTHVLVVPKTRYRNAAELAAAEPDLLAELVRVASDIAEREGIAESGYRLLFNTNADAGQTIFHVHLHLLGGEPLGGLTGGPLKG